MEVAIWLSPSPAGPLYYLDLPPGSVKGLPATQLRARHVGEAGELSFSFSAMNTVFCTLPLPVGAD